MRQEIIYNFSFSLLFLFAVLVTLLSLSLFSLFTAPWSSSISVQHCLLCVRKIQFTFDPRADLDSSPKEQLETEF